MTREIPLSRGLVAIVDDEDYAQVSAVGKWYADRSCRTFYARRNYWRDGQCLSIKMHILLTGWRLVDHRNGNGLDNRRANLRPASNAENARNRQRRSDNTSGFKGVSQHASGRWEASIWADGKSRYLGLFNNSQDAARVYDAAALRAFGEFARLNFPTERAS